MSELRLHETELVTKDGQRIRLAVFGHFADDGRTLVARLIVLLPPKT